jgi:hypothetical protein
MTAYKTQGALRKALEERLKQKSKLENVDINRLRRQLAFDRLLARLFHDEAAPWALKGGYALELLFKAARSTVDIDLTMFRPVATTQGPISIKQFASCCRKLPACHWGTGLNIRSVLCK